MQYLDKGIAEQRRQYDQTRSDFAPYRDFGGSALGPLGDLLGLNGPDKASAAIATLKDSPLFTSLFNTGQEAVLQNASATGGLRGGNTQGALYELGDQTLSHVIGDQISRLGGAVGVGEGATDATAGFGAHTADALTQLFGEQGSALASKYLAKAGIRAKTWGNIGNFADSVASAAMGAGAGPGGAPFNFGAFAKSMF